MRKFIDLTGQKFNKLTVLERAENYKSYARWKCVCDCGKITFVLGSHLRNNHTKSCGCLVIEKAKEGKSRLVDMIGNKIGRLTFIEQLGSTKFKQVLWRCLCDCGKEVVTKGSAVRNGNTRSCGCLKDEIQSLIHLKHGHSKNGKSKEYIVWASMKSRCVNPKSKIYEHYGGRGIKVCDRWMDFNNFLEDMGERPSLKYSIERKDVNGNYESNNCKWATDFEQSINNRLRSNNKTGHRGISVRNKKYVVTIGANHKRFHIGEYVNLEDAIKARKEAELKYWGKSS